MGRPVPIFIDELESGICGKTWQWPGTPGLAAGEYICLKPAGHDGNHFCKEGVFFDDEGNPQLTSRDRLS